MSRRDQMWVQCLAGRLVGVLAALATCALACDCGNGNPGRDADAGEDRADDALDVAEDVADGPDAEDAADDGFEEADAPEAFDGDGEDAGERYIAPWDGDLDYAEYAAEHDCAPPEPIAGCETPGAETPIWERSVGDEWCINPIYRDLRPLWREVAPGCEQVTYLDYIGSGFAASDSYDVWDGRLIVVGGGITIVDAECRSESRIQVRERTTEGELMFEGWPVGSRNLDAFRKMWSTDAAGYNSVLVTYDPASRQKKLIHGEHNPDLADSRGTVDPLDASAGTILGRRNRLRESRCEFDLVSVDLLSGAVLDLSGTDLPFGRCVWAGSLWENTGVVSGSSWNLHLVDVTTPGVRVFGETAPCQWNAVVQGDTVCWEQTTEFCPLDTGPGNRVFCAGLGDGTPWDASPVVTCEDGTACGACEPTVFGPWVAWVLTPGTVCFGYEVALLNRRTAQEYRLFDRTTGFRPSGLVYDVRLWGNHLYFLTEPPGVGGNVQVHRCDLRVLFSEAYE